MSIAVEPCRGNESAFLPETQSQQGSAGSSIQLPNVFVTPPEEEFDTPAWCCFDADKDAQPGAFVYDDLQHQDFDYAAHAEEEIFGRGVEGHVLADNMPGSREREDVFVMHSLMQEAEHLKERLKSLDLSAGSFSFTAPLPAEEGEDEMTYDEPLTTAPTFSTFSTTIEAVEVEQKVKRRKSLFAFRPLSRRKSFDETSSANAISTVPPVPSASLSDADNALSGSGVMSATQDSMDAASMRSGSSRKSSGFFSRFRLSSKKSSFSSDDARQGRKSISACRSQDELPAAQEQEQEPVLKRRFSIFDLPRRRASFNSQRIPTSGSTAPSMMRSMNQSTSSLSTSSVPPTPDVATCILISPPTSPTEKTANRRLPTMNMSFLSTMNDAHGVDNIAASLALPASHHGIVPDSQFSLDPLHFESLQFDSDDFA
ncbi:hypothetical protein ACEPAI_4938 [Sanghuangporus weigelae]